MVAPYIRLNNWCCPWTPGLSKPLDIKPMGVCPLLTLAVFSAHSFFFFLVGWKPDSQLSSRTLYYFTNNLLFPFTHIFYDHVHLPWSSGCLSSLSYFYYTESHFFFMYAMRKEEYLSVFVGLWCHNKISLAGCLKEQTFIFSRFWRLEVWGKVPAWSGPIEISFIDPEMAAFLFCPHMAGERKRG